jgi:hypothetical protein
MEIIAIELGFFADEAAVMQNGGLDCVGDVDRDKQS